MKRKGCMFEITKKEELKQLQNNFGHVVLLLHSKNCSHCKEDELELSKKCEDFKNTPIAFAKCEVSNPECKELWIQSKPKEVKNEEYGIPVKVGLSKDTDINHPIWHILGRDTDKMNFIIDELKKAIGASNNEQQNSQQVQRTQQQRQQQQQYAHQNQNPYQEYMKTFVASPSAKNKLMIVQSNVPEQNTLCVSCDPQTRIQSMKRFILGY